jgi:hypothetical protein
MSAIENQATLSVRPFPFAQASVGVFHCAREYPRRPTQLKWYEIVQIAKTIQFTQDPDTLVWKFTSNGFHNVKSMYAVVNFRGIRTIDVQSVWKVKVPPKIHFFLWLVFYKKLLRRDNLSKRQQVEDLSCIFCNELESCEHLLLGLNLRE